MIPFYDWPDLEPEDIEVIYSPPEYDKATEHGLLCEYCCKSEAWTVMEFNLLPILLCVDCSMLTEDEVNYEIGQI